MFLGCVLTIAVSAMSFGQDTTPSEKAPPKTPTSGQVWVQDIPGTASSLTMRPVTLPDGGEMWVMEREVTWNLFDVFIFRLDEKKKKSSPDSDAVTRPTKPYIAVDRGFGHNDYPALSMSLKNAVQFAKWISAKTGRTYRIPTVDEWKIDLRSGVHSLRSTRCLRVVRKPTAKRRRIPSARRRPMHSDFTISTATSVNGVSPEEPRKSRRAS